jgi:circadian clock protein KaiC
MRSTFYSSRHSAGTSSFDQINLCNLPGNQVFLIKSDLGTEKESLATQFILEGKRQKDFCLNVTLSETNNSL